MSNFISKVSSQAVQIIISMYDEIKNEMNLNIKKMEL